MLHGITPICLSWSQTKGLSVCTTCEVKVGTGVDGDDGGGIATGEVKVGTGVDGDDGGGIATGEVKVGTGVDGDDGGGIATGEVKVGTGVDGDDVVVLHHRPLEKAVPFLSQWNLQYMSTRETSEPSLLA